MKELSCSAGAPCDNHVFLDVGDAAMGGPNLGVWGLDAN